MDNNENNKSGNDSYYSYSYVRDGGNENTTWRANDYTNQSSGQTQGTYYETPKEKHKWFRRKNKKTNYGNKKSFGMKIARCAVLAAVFGLVAGGVFVGTGYLGMSKLGIGKEGSASTKTVEQTKITGTPASTNTTGTGVLDVSDIVDEVMPSIVAITNMTEIQQRNFFGQVQNYDAESAGSGIIIGQDNDNLYIVTNNHVVTGSDSLTVCFVDDQTVAAEIKGTDSSSDLAVLAVKISDVPSETMNNIKVAVMGDSSDVKVGESAIAIGNALGYGQSVTTGVISALDREGTLQDELTGGTITNELIQTDAAINPGNSGGALLNLQGEVIGINSAKYSDTQVEGMGYAIPIATAKPIIEDLINRETVDASESAYLGVAGSDITEDVAQTYSMPRGIYITKVVNNSAAEKAGIQKGQILTKFDGKKVSSMEGMQEMLQYYKAGEKVTVTVQVPNNGQYEEKDIEVTLGKKVD